MDIDNTNHIMENLGEMTEALTAPNTLDEGLRLIVRLTCKLLDTSQAAVLLLDEGKQQFIVQAATGLECANVRVGFPLILPPRLQNILLKLQHIHSINWVDAGLDGVIFPIISIPLFYKGNRIGILFAGGAQDQARANEPMRQKLFSLLAPFASLIIENARAMDIIKQRFMTNARRHMQAVLADEHALTPSSKSKDDKAAEKTAPSTEQLVTTSIRNPSKVVKILTETYYRELIAAGFDDSQITTAASHLINCIIHKGNPPRED